MATMLPGVLPSICWASVPTLSSLPVFLSSATTDGSRSTIPLSLIYTSTLAVPKSMPISLANIVFTPVYILRLSPSEGSLPQKRFV